MDFEVTSITFCGVQILRRVEDEELAQRIADPQDLWDGLLAVEEEEMRAAIAAKLQAQVIERMLAAAVNLGTHT